MTTDTNQTIEKEATLSAHEFLNFGMDQMAYVKAMRADDGHEVFGIYAADGTELTVLDQFDSAIAVVRDNDLTPLSVH